MHVCIHDNATEFIVTTLKWKKSKELNSQILVSSAFNRYANYGQNFCLKTPDIATSKKLTY